VLGFELLDFIGDGRRQLGTPPPAAHGLQSGLASQPVLLQPHAEDAFADAQLLADQGLTEPFLQMQPNGLELFSHGVAPRCFRAASPPRGALPLLFYYGLFIHVNTPFIIGVSTTFLLNSVS
jgi:hypothetical protein